MDSLLIIIGVIAAFFIFRFVNLWYWRTNEYVELLQEQTRLLKKLAGETTNQKSISSTDDWSCPKCGAKNSNSTFTCSSCGHSLK